MKKILLFLSSLGLLTACYDPYTQDYDYDAIFFTYQYDLRTFVLGESQSFQIGVALGGVVENTRDREIGLVMDNGLVVKDLSLAIPANDNGYGSFYAIDGLTGKGKFGTLAQGYVKSEVQDAGISSLRALPSEYFKVDGLKDMKMEKGRHTAKATITATDAILDDSHIYKPYYGLGFKILYADADTVLPERSFQVVAVKCENRFFGNWYHGGKTVVKKDVTGELISEDDYSIDFPQNDDRTYTLTTVDANTVNTNKVGLALQSPLKLVFNGNDITVSSADGSLDIQPIEGSPSYFNGAKKIQDRVMYLNYCYSNGDGTTTYVTDQLAFRSRMRDGIIEFDDLNPENYK